MLDWVAGLVAKADMQNLFFLTWPKLRRLGTNRAVRSANVWALVVPITAHLLEQVQDAATIELFGHKLEIQLSLPFSWKILFIAAIAFLFANIVYSVWCPPLIKETEAYRDFAEQKRSAAELAGLLQELKQKGQMTTDNSNKWESWLNSRQVTSAHQQSHTIPPEMEDRAFIELYAVIVNALASTNIPARKFASYSYVLGMAALGIIVLQNIWFVATNW